MQFLRASLELGILHTSARCRLRGSQLTGFQLWAAQFAEKNAVICVSRPDRGRNSPCKLLARFNKRCGGSDAKLGRFKTPRYRRTKMRKSRHARVNSAAGHPLEGKSLRLVLWLAWQANFNGRMSVINTNILTHLLSRRMSVLKYGPASTATLIVVDTRSS